MGLSLTVKLTITKNEPQQEQQGGDDVTTAPNEQEQEGGDGNGEDGVAQSLEKLDITNKNGNENKRQEGGEDTQQKVDEEAYTMNIESVGKLSRKATWEDLASYAKLEPTAAGPDMIKSWLHTYQEECFPEQLELPNHVPKTSFLKDEKKGYTIFKDYGWKPIKLNLATARVDVKERWTKEIVLEEFPLDYTTNLEKVLMEQGDKSVTSTLTKGKLAGHPLAMAMMKSKSEITTEFRGMDSVVLSLGNNQAAGVVDEETGAEVWTDTKTLRALLKDKPLPVKNGAGSKRTAKVLALESYLKARVYYRATFSGTVTTDHGNEQFDGLRYWNWPLKYLLQYNDIPSAAVIYEDVELHFFTKVHIAMDNKGWAWAKDEEGGWFKKSNATA
jgi:hypothetical protein